MGSRRVSGVAPSRKARFPPDCVVVPAAVTGEALGVPQLASLVHGNVVIVFFFAVFTDFASRHCGLHVRDEWIRSCVLGVSGCPHHRVC